MRARLCCFAAVAAALIGCSDGDDLAGKPSSSRGRPSFGVGKGAGSTTEPQATPDTSSAPSTPFELIITDAELAGAVGGIEFSGAATGQASLGSDGTWVQVYFDDGNKLAMTGVHVRDLAELTPGHSYSSLSNVDLWAWACSGVTSMNYEARAISATIDVSETDAPNVIRYDIVTQLPSGNTQEQTFGWFAVHW